MRTNLTRRISGRIPRWGLVVALVLIMISPLVGSRPAQAAASQDGFLFANQQLARGELVYSANRLYALVHQTDGNVVLYGPSGWIWQTGTGGHATTAFAMQGDGNLVLYNRTVPVWTTATNQPGSFLAVADDSNLIIYNSARQPVWVRGQAQHLLQGPRECRAALAQQYRDCVTGTNLNEYDSIVITRMIPLDESWRTAGLAWVGGKRIVGLGHQTGFRYTGRQFGAAVHVSHSNNIYIGNMAIEGTFSMTDTERDCVSQGCETPLFINGDLTNGATRDITIEYMKIANSRGDSAGVIGATGVVWRHSVIDNAYWMGLHVGFDSRDKDGNQIKNQWVRRLTVEHSTFTNVRTNALWLQTDGNDNYGDNVVQESRFYNNHRMGAYDCGSGISCSGGQIGVSFGTNSLTMRRILIADGSCPLCTTGSVHGIEMNALRRVRVVDSEIRNNRGAAIMANWDDRHSLEYLEIGNNCLRYNDEGLGFHPEHVKLVEKNFYNNQLSNCDKGLG